MHIITGLAAGGAERSLYNLLAGGAAELNDCVVISLQDEGVYGPQIRALGVPLYSLGQKKCSFQGIAAFRKFRQLIRAFNPIIIQGWMYHGNLAALFAASVFATAPTSVVWNIRQCLYSLHGEKMLTRFVILSNRFASRWVDAIIYNSRLSCEQHESFGFSDKRQMIIPNGFDIERFQPDPLRRRAIRGCLRIPENSIVIGHVARFHPMKDHATFLTAVVEVMRHRHNVFCLMAGKNVDLGNPSLASIVPVELKSRFRFVGERDDIPDLMRTMDLLCLSSWSEAFPNVIGEAMALGVPCVATDVGDVAVILGDTGWLVPSGNPWLFACAIRSAIEASASKKQWLNRQRRCRQKICDEYALEKMVDRYQETWMEVAALRAPRL